MHRLMLVVVLALACNKAEQPTTPPEPDAGSPGAGPDVGGFDFVSGEHEERTAADYVDVDEPNDDHVDDSAFEVTSVQQARDVAEAAVADSLNPKKQWKTSPVLPAAWPSKGPSAMFLFYPMAVHPESMERYELYSAKWVVVVELTDGSTDVIEINKSRRLGTIEGGRPSSLERRELEMAEDALMVLLLGGESQTGENRFWGYLKYFHEHPKIGGDIKKRRPGFIKWLKGRPHHT